MRVDAGGGALGCVKVWTVGAEARVWCETAGRTLSVAAVLGLSGPSDAGGRCL